jgi:hypothetical protein
MSNAMNLAFEILKMIRFGIKFLAVMLLSVAIVSCASLRPRQRVENPELANVKFAYISAEQGVPVAVLGNVQSQLAASIASTYRNVATDPVYLTVRVSDISVQKGGKMPVYTVMLNTILSDTRDGQVVSSNDIQANAVVPRGKSLNEQIAGAIVERLRFTYNLASPPQPNVAIAMPRKTSTQIAIDQPDALLNATTKIGQDEPAAVSPANTARTEKTLAPHVAKPAPAAAINKPVANQAPAVVMDRPAAPAVATKNGKFIGPVLPENSALRISTTIMPKSAPAKAEPATPPVVVPATSNLENGAVSKIVIPASKATVPAKPAAAAASDEPCVVTAKNDCSVPQ